MLFISTTLEWTPSLALYFRQLLIQKLQQILPTIGISKLGSDLTSRTATPPRFFSELKGKA